MIRLHFRLSRIARFMPNDETNQRKPGFCSQLQGWMSVEINEDLPWRGGMFTSSRLISPSMTACRCSAIASRCQPATYFLPGSMTFHAPCAKSLNERRHSSASMSRSRGSIMAPPIDYPLFELRKLLIRESLQCLRKRIRSSDIKRRLLAVLRHQHFGMEDEQRIAMLAYSLRKHTHFVD